MKNSLWKCSLFLYGVVFIFIISMTDIQRMRFQRLSYLAGMMSRSTGLREKDRIGVLYFDTMSRVLPKDGRIYVDLGLCYYRLGQEKEAIASFNKAFSLGVDPNKLINK